MGSNRQDVDYFSVFFDTYNDQQNGFQFLVTTANVQSDARIGSGGYLGFGDFGDKTWDAVWQSQVKMKPTAGRWRCAFLISPSAFEKRCADLGTAVPAFYPA